MISFECKHDFQLKKVCLTLRIWGFYNINVTAADLLNGWDGWDGQPTDADPLHDPLRQWWLNLSLISVSQAFSAFGYGSLCLCRFLCEVTHCLDLDLNGLLTRRNFWRIPGMLGHYTIPKWKEFLKSREPILRKSYLSTFIHINKHMDGARDTFLKILKNCQNGTFLPMHENQNFFGPNDFIWSAKKVPFMWIKVDK